MRFVFWNYLALCSTLGDSDCDENYTLNGAKTCKAATCGAADKGTGTCCEKNGNQSLQYRSMIFMYFWI